MAKDKRLGRGLDALFGHIAAAQPNAGSLAPSYDGESTVDDSNDYAPTVAFPNQDVDETSSRKRAAATEREETFEEAKDRAAAKFSDGRVATEIPLDLVDRNPYQPRLHFDAAELNDLKESLLQHGMLQPLVARQNGERYELVAGERRFRAAQELGWEKAPAIIIVVEDRQMAELALTENMQRRDLNPIEKAAAFRNYLKLFGGTHDELARRISLQRSTVSNLMRLLDLNEEVQDLVRSEELSQGHARALLSLDDDDQMELAKRVIDEGLSVRDTEAIVREYLANIEVPTTSEKGKSKSVREVSPHVQELENQFRSWLGMKIRLTSNEKGKGKLVIQFASNDEFERIYQALKPKDF